MKSPDQNRVYGIYLSYLYRIWSYFLFNNESVTSITHNELSSLLPSTSFDANDILINTLVNVLLMRTRLKTYIKSLTVEYQTYEYQTWKLQIPFKFVDLQPFQFTWNAPLEK